jgi:hypothetical protein
LKLVTVNGYKYATTVSSSRVKIDSLLLFYFDDQKQEDLNDVVHNEHMHKLNPKYFCTSLDCMQIMVNDTITL